MALTPAKNIKKIGVLTSGGDCAGLNAAIYGVVQRATLGYGWAVTGIRHTELGLRQRPPAADVLMPHIIAPLVRMGGSLLGSYNRGAPFIDNEEDRRVISDGYHLLGLDALVVIGGDGSQMIFEKLAQLSDMRMVGIPKTMDNDVGCTDYAIGFDTAVMVATEALDRLQPTAASHDRIMVLEVMGRDAGHVALAAGVAGAADVILIPEIPYDLDKVVAHIKKLYASGKTHATVVVNEAVRTQAGDKIMNEFTDGAKRYGGIGPHLAQMLAARTGAEARATVLGHVVRGAPPTAFDRTLAYAFGTAAVDLIAAGKFGHMVAWQNQQVTSVPISQVVQQTHFVDPHGTLVQTARGLGVCFGD